MDTTTQTDPAQSGDQGQSQGTPADTGLNTAMDNWGTGDGQQAAPETQQQTSTPAQTSAPATPATPATPAQAATPATPSAAPAVTGDAIKAAIDATAQAMLRQNAALRQTPNAPAKEMTDDEFNAHYGIPKVDIARLERLFDKDPAKGAAALEEIMAQNRTASLKMAKDLIDLQIGQRMEAFQPRVSAMEKFIQEQTEAKATDRFYTAFPDLKPEQDMVNEILAAVHARRKTGELKFTDEAQAFKFVADATNQRISTMRSKYGASTPNGQPSGQQTPPTGGRQMASATSAARPGGQTSRPATDLDKVMSAWDQQPD